MWQLLHKNNKSPFRIIIFGFLLVILVGSLLLMLPISTKAGICTPFFRCSVYFNICSLCYWISDP